jgi:hypothetical protein
MHAHFDRLVFFAGQVQQMRQAADATSASWKRALKAWQSQRLAATHGDLLIDPKFSAAAKFFLDDLYGEKDFSQRDKDLKRLLPALGRFLPDSALAAIADAVELDALSESMDARLALRLQLSKVSEISQIDYAMGYASMVKEDQLLEPPKDDRLRQIALMRQIGVQLDKLVRQPLLSGMLKTMALPAQASGLGELHSFLLRGFLAFKALGGAKTFLDLIESRERAQHDAWIALDEQRLSKL